MKKSSLLAAVALALFAGCHRDSAPPRAVGPPTRSAPQQSAGGDGQQASPTPIKDTVEDLIAADAERPNHHFPPGVRVHKVSLSDGVATVDFSREFDGLADMGESNESIVQKALRKTLAAFPRVQKMRVTVNGRPFQSESTDWNTPMRVRDTGGEAGPVDSPGPLSAQGDPRDGGL